jgi:hypothetical protein
VGHARRKIDAQISATLKAATATENAGAKEFVALVNKLRQEIVLAIIEAGELDKRTADAVKQRLAFILKEYEKRFAEHLSANERRLFIKGIQIVDNAVSGADLRVAVPYLSEQTLAQVQSYSATLITNITEEIRSRITQELDLAVLGQKRQLDVVRAIGQNLKDPSIFRTIARRAETIFRTEVNRVQNISAAQRIKQVAQIVPDLKKQWMHSHQGAPRPNHLALDGTQVDSNGRFELKGEDGRIYKIFAPHDPILPAREVVNCRCQAIPVVGRFAKS